MEMSEYEDRIDVKVNVFYFILIRVSMAFSASWRLI